MNRKEKREKKEKINVLNDLVSIIRQYFPELVNKFNGLTDLRNQSYVVYQRHMQRKWMEIYNTI